MRRQRHNSTSLRYEALEVRNLLATFYFDGALGSVAKTTDSSGELQLIEQGTLSSTDGVDGSSNAAYGFDGDDYLQIGDVYATDLDFFAEFWVRADGASHNAVMLQGATEMLDESFALRVSEGESATTVVFESDRFGDTFSAYGQTDIGDGEWHHVVLNVSFLDDSGETAVQLIVDGQLDAEETGAGGMLAEPLNWLVAAEDKNGIENQFSGSIDNLTIAQGTWDASLSSSLFEQDENTIAIWRMNGIAGSVNKPMPANGNAIFYANEIGMPQSDIGYDGVTNGAYDFSSGDHLAIVNASGADYGNQTTIEALVYYEASGEQQLIYADWDWNPWKNIMLGVDADGYLFGQRHTGRTTGSILQQAKSSDPLAPNEWHYVAMTTEVGEKVRVFVNGTLVGESAEVLPEANLETTTFNGAQIGALNYHSDIQFPWNGNIDEVMLSSIAKDETSIAESYQRIKPGTDLTVSSVNFLDANEDTILFDVTSIRVTGDVEVVLVRSDNLRFDTSDELLASKTVTFSGDETLSDYFDLSIDDQILNADAPFYLVVVDPSEPGGSGSAIEVDESNNTGVVLKDNDYIFVDFGFGFRFSPDLGYSTLSGTVAGLRDIALARDFTKPYELFDFGYDDTDFVEIRALKNAVYETAIDYNQDQVRNDLDVIDLADDTFEIIRELFTPFASKIVRSSASSFSEINQILELGFLHSEYPYQPTYSLVAGRTNVAADSTLLGIAPSVDSVQGPNEVFLNTRMDTVLVFAENALREAAVANTFGQEYAYLLANVTAHEIGHAIGAPHLANNNQSIMAKNANIEDDHRLNMFTRFPSFILEEHQREKFGSDYLNQYELVAYALGESEHESFVIGTQFDDIVEIEQTPNDTYRVSITAPATSLGTQTYEVEKLDQLVIWTGDGNDKIIMRNMQDTESLLPLGGNGIDYFELSSTSYDDDVEFGLRNRRFYEAFSVEHTALLLGDGNDSLSMNSAEYVGLLTVFGGAGDDTIALGGLATGTTVFGGKGNDSIIGTAFADYLYGGQGNDTISGGSGNDSILGGSGDDRLFGALGIDRLFGGDGRDEVHGGDGDDMLDGGSGMDFLFGDAGNDALFGGRDLEVDILVGGDGSDLFYLLRHDDDSDFRIGEDRHGRNRRR